MNVKINITALTNVGSVRENNEDNFIVCSDLTNDKWEFTKQLTELGDKGAVFAVADGMGGQNAGEIASDLAVKTIKKQFSLANEDTLQDEVLIQQFLYDTVRMANDVINDYANKNPESLGMGTTLVLAWVLKQKIHIAWCGDSRAYAFDDQGLHLITKDHSYVQELVDKKIITREQAFYHPDKNIITRCLGNNDNNISQPDIISIPIRQNMKLMLCSDGLNGMVEDEKIAEVLSNCNSIEETKEKLVEEALNAGGNDNVTVVLCDINAEMTQEAEDIHVTQKNKKKSGIKWAVTISLLALALLFLYKFLM